MGSGYTKICRSTFSLPLHEKLDTDQMNALMSKIVEKRTVPLDENKWINFSGDHEDKSK